MKPSVALNLHRPAIREMVLAHRARNVRVFGSAAHGHDREDSDLDLLVDPTPDTSLMDIASLQVKLKNLLGVSVDVLTPRSLPESFRAQVLAHAHPV